MQLGVFLDIVVGVDDLVFGWEYFYVEIDVIFVVVVGGFVEGVVEQCLKIVWVSVLYYRQVDVVIECSEQVIDGGDSVVVVCGCFVKESEVVLVLVVVEVEVGELVVLEVEVVVDVVGEGEFFIEFVVDVIDGNMVFVGFLFE